MASKIESIITLAQEKTMQLTSSYENYQEFLRCSAWSYKYSFADQLLIYAQRPDATAVASFDIWNKKLHRYINRGAKGIALIDDNRSDLKLHYVFDVSDTNHPEKAPLSLWQVKESYKENIIEQLADSFDLELNPKRFEGSLYQLSDAVASDVLDGYLSDLMSALEGSDFEGVDQDSLSEQFKILLASSVHYKLLVRLGMEADAYWNASDFEGIEKFNTIETISILGSAVSDATETILQEIGTMAKHIELEEKQNELEEEKHERTDIQNGRGISDSESGTRRTDGNDAREIRDDEKNIFERTQEGFIHESDVERGTDAASSSYRPDSKGESGTDREEEGIGEHSSRQDAESSAVGGTDEYVENDGRGNSAERTNLWLSDDWQSEIARLLDSEPSHIFVVRNADENCYVFGDFAKTINELPDVTQAEYDTHKGYDFDIPFCHFPINVLDENLNAFTAAGCNVDISNAVDLSGPVTSLTVEASRRAVLNELSINGILQSDEFMQHKKEEVVEFFLEHEDSAERAAFISECYDFSYCQYQNPSLGHVKTEDNRLHLWEGNFITRTAEIFLTFDEIQERIGELIKDHKYLSIPEHITFPTVHEQQEAIEIAIEGNSQPENKVSQEDIDSVLVSGSSFMNGKHRIYEFFKKEPSTKDAIEFLKNEYGTGGGTFNFPDGSHGSQNHDSKGISINKSGFSRENATLLKWNEVYKRLNELISLNRYMNSKELSEHPAFLEEVAKMEERYAFGKELQDFYREFTKNRIEEHTPSAKGVSLYVLTSHIHNYMAYDSEFGKASLLSNLNDILEMEDITEEEKEAADRFYTKLAEEIEVIDLDNTVSEIQTKTVPSYKEGDTVYLGSADYTILEAGEKVLLSDNSFPLFSADYTKEEFEEKLLENPLNAHLTMEIPIEETVDNEEKEALKDEEEQIDKVAGSNNEKAVDSKEEEQALSGAAAYRYYSIHRPVDIGTYPNSSDNSPTEFKNFDNEMFIKEIGQWAFGYLEYAKPLTDEEISNYELTYLPPAIIDEKGREYRLGYGELGNGTTVWNRMEEENGDYKTIAHISDEGEITLYDSNLPDMVIDDIKETAIRAIGHADFNHAKEPVKGLESENIKPASEAVKISISNSTAHENFNFLKEFIPQIMDREYSYAHFEREGFEPLSIEWIGGNNLSIMHTFVQNGDLMRDPDLTLAVDFEKEEVYPRSYEMSSLGVYQEVVDYETKEINHSLERQLNDFFKEWSKNIIEQDFSLTRAVLEHNGEKIDLTVSNDNILEKQEEKAVNILSSLLEYYDSIKPNDEDFLASNDEVRNKIEKLDSYIVTDDYEKNLEEIEMLVSFISEWLPDQESEEVINQFTTDLENANAFLSENRNAIENEPQIAPVSEVNEDHGISGQPITEIDSNEDFERESIDIKSQYRITDDNLGIGGPKVKYANNIAAIKLLKQLEKEERMATPSEQEVLSKYVGWGGVASAFDERDPSWQNEYKELKELLTDEEYAAARESTLTAYYTQPAIIRAMYDKLADLGFINGNILEPSCGVGNFLGMLPEEMSDSKMYGVELDQISGKIAQQLYQKSNIAVAGYEKTELPDSFFDLAIGNVPFGQFKVLDKRYDKHNFMIHDYFFAKTLDKVRPGGVVAFITSKGTMDKLNGSVRKYIAQRADLLGAVRLPDTAFLGNAGTKATADILFLQKRDRIIDIEPDWIGLDNLIDSQTGEVICMEDGSPAKINTYFAKHPEMVLGTMAVDKMQYGREDTTCKAIPDADLSLQLKEAFSHISGEIVDFEREEDDPFEKENVSIAADPNVRNFSYTLVDGDVYFRENSRMNLVDAPKARIERIKGMMELRDCVHNLIEYQTLDFSDEAIKNEQKRLNELYDSFTAKYGLINSRGNNMAFSDDSAYYLLCSLEVLDKDGQLKEKSAMFSKRTIGFKEVVTSVDTSIEALAVSISEKARVDLEYMHELTGKSIEEITDDLKGVIFPNPMKFDENGVVLYETADEYLSGNVREKLDFAEYYAEQNPEKYSGNVIALQAAQPVPLEVSDISVRLGATWIEPEYIKEFIIELLELSKSRINNFDVLYSDVSGSWNITNKSSDSGNVLAHSTYGTNRANAYKIIEDTLNLKDVRIFDYEYDEEGHRKQILNQKETTVAQLKQESIKEAFETWIWKEPERRNYLVEKYNRLFNSIRPREYDGSHITFNNMTPDINLLSHQKNAAARILYGGNTLLGHVVGAGKTYTMVAAAMESKRLGLSEKSLFVVPNHLIEQWAAEFLRLYPSANILVATKKDFETKNRKKFCGRIATGDYDAVIIGHSQFEKIPMSVEHQKEMLEEEMRAITDGIADLKASNGEQFSIKQMEKTKKTLSLRLERLNDDSRKDDVVTFEQLGVDRLFVDEAHYYKNLFLYTKMRNVGGIAQTEAKKSSDLYMKTRYLSEMTGGRGVVFATGTPISNSMTELYTMQRYLQYDMLQKLNLTHFDAWASTFGETVTAIELAPEGTGYRAKTRFSKFYNLPELMSIFKDVADIQTSDMLDLPVPQANYHVVSVKPSEYQKEIVKGLSERADKVRSKMVDPTVDNMLKITNDGRKLALDQRLLNSGLPDDENSKVSSCANNVFNIWDKNKGQKSTQLVFCDLSTPHGDGEFNVYDDLKKKLIEKGIPENEIAYIHDANTDKRKEALFENVRQGNVRVLLGSTFKMGAGTNVQDKLIAMHDLDCPWRPSDLEQRAGRIVRQGNSNPEVEIFRYVTEGTFDAYLYQLVENKQRFISQIMTSKSPVRSAEDIDEASLSYAEIKALAAGNPMIKEKMDLDIQVSRLKTLKSSYLNNKYRLEDKLLKFYPSAIKTAEMKIDWLKKDVETAKSSTIKGEEGISPMVIQEKTFTDRKEAGEMLLSLCKVIEDKASLNTEKGENIKVGSYRGFDFGIHAETKFNEKKFLTVTPVVTLKGSSNYSIDMGKDASGNITRLDNFINNLPEKLTEHEEKLSELYRQKANAEVEVKKPFEKEEELKNSLERLAELNILLDQDSHSSKEEDKDDVLNESDNKVSSVDALIGKAKAIKEEQCTNESKHIMRREENIERY